MLKSEKGITMVEVLIAMMLTMVAVVSVLSMEPMAWKTAAKSDHLGRAAGILQSELELRENQLASGYVAFTGDNTRNVKVSNFMGTPAANTTGDDTFSVKTNITQPVANNANWDVVVNVTWSGSTTGIAGCINVSRINGFNKVKDMP